MTITIMYSCPACNVRNQKLDVPMRESPNDSVLKWMEQTIRLVGEDHQKDHPGCRVRRLRDLTIPITNVEWIGGPPIT